MRLALIRIHNFVEYGRAVLHAVAPHVDGFVFRYGRETDPEARAIAEDHPKRVGSYESDQPWSQSGSYQELFDFAARFSPGVVWYGDHDELPPPQLATEIDRMLRDGADLMGFRYLFPWGDTDTVLAPDYPPHTGPLYKLLRWRPGITWHPYRGCCRPCGEWTPTVCRYPARHLAFMRPEWREAKATTMRRRGYDPAWLRGGPPTVPFDHNRTWEKYRD